uniref:Uncharacterized protein n=1 Tax=Anguilla anguilla TaxID=7936 RepID=A0A0E9XQ61_ANGAN
MKKDLKFSRCLTPTFRTIKGEKAPYLEIVILNIFQFSTRSMFTYDITSRVSTPTL